MVKVYFPAFVGVPAATLAAEWVGAVRLEFQTGRECA